PPGTHAPAVLACGPPPPMMISGLGKAYLTSEGPVVAASLYLVAGKAPDSVTRGFLPAAARLGLDVTLLRDRSGAAHGSGGRVVACDVFDCREIVAAAAAGDGEPAAVFAHGDFLQAPTALAAPYFGLPGKDWR